MTNAHTKATFIGRFICAISANCFSIISISALLQHRLTQHQVGIHYGCCFRPTLWVRKKTRHYSCR